MELHNGLLLRAAQGLSETALSQAINPVVMVDDSVGAIVSRQAAHQILSVGLAGQRNLRGQQPVEIVATRKGFQHAMGRRPEQKRA